MSDIVIVGPGGPTGGSGSSSSGAAGQGPSASNQLLSEWGYTQAFAAVTATRNAANVLTSATIVWPDGSTGVFTADTISSLNTIDAWHATYVNGSVTKTVAQPLVTRNASGAVTAQPTITVQ